MDENALRHYGLSMCRINLAKKLLTKTFTYIQLTFILLYLFTVVSYFVILDLTHNEKIGD